MIAPFKDMAVKAVAVLILVAVAERIVDSRVSYTLESKKGSWEQGLKDFSTSSPNSLCPVRQGVAMGVETLPPGYPYSLTLLHLTE